MIAVRLLVIPALNRDTGPGFERAVLPSSRNYRVSAARITAR